MHLPLVSDLNPCSAWALLPGELGARFAHPRGEHVFGALQRPWTWRDGRPALAARVWREVEALGAALPRVAALQASADGAQKLLFALPGRGEHVEAVHMPRAVRGERVTLCVSSQVGCALACAFCATGELGFGRQLGAGEIVGQILVALGTLGPRHPGELTLVFMGMGEPLHNWFNVTRALEVLTHPLGLGLSPRRITVSTAGLVPQIDALAKLEARPLLAVSLNATTDELRSKLMPINRRYSLTTLLAALERYPCRPRERITVEYVLLAGVNDTNDDARRLADLCVGFPHQVNLIPFNPHPGTRFRAPSAAGIDAFARALLAHRRSVVTVRRSRGPDVAGACGQLAGTVGPVPPVG